jgi:hypothetical protein
MDHGMISIKYRGIQIKINNNAELMFKHERN